MSHPDPKFMKRYLKPLIGCVVTKIRARDGFAALVFQSPDGVEYVCDISSDEEGNAPGFLFGLPHPGGG
jgi:hypothetical protein